MENATNQVNTESKKTRRDSSNKNTSSSQANTDKTPQSTPRIPKTKTSGSTSKPKTEARPTKDQKSSHKSSGQITSEDKSSKPSRNSPSRTRSSTRKSNTNLQNETQKYENSSTELDHDLNALSSQEKANKSSGPKNSTSKSITSHQLKSSKSKSPGPDDQKKGATSKTHHSPDTDESNNTGKKGVSKSGHKLKSKPKLNKTPSSFQLNSENESLDNDIDHSTRLSLDSAMGSKSTDSKPKNLTGILENGKVLNTSNSTTILKSKSDGFFEYNNILSMKKNDSSTSDISDWKNVSNILHSSQHLNGFKSSDVIPSTKIEINHRKITHKTSSEKFKAPAPKYDDIFGQVSKLTIAGDQSDNQSYPPAFKLSENKISTFNSKADPFMTVTDKLRMQMQSLDKTSSFSSSVSNDLTTSISNPSRTEPNLSQDLPIYSSITSGGTRVLSTSKGSTLMSKSDLTSKSDYDTRNTLSSTIALNDSTTTTSYRKLSDFKVIKEKMNTQIDDKDKRSNKVGKMVIRSQTDWLPRKNEHKERIWNNVTTTNDPNRFLDCDTGLVKETMRDFIHRQITSKKVNSSSICPEGKKAFFDYINELKIQKVTYSQWEYQRNIERAKRGMPHGLNIDSPLGMFRGDQSAHILRGLYHMQPYNLQANLI